MHNATATSVEVPGGLHNQILVTNVVLLDGKLALVVQDMELSYVSNARAVVKKYRMVIM